MAIAVTPKGIEIIRITTPKTFLMISRNGGTSWEKLIDIKDFPDLGGVPEMLDYLINNNHTEISEGARIIDVKEITQNIKLFSYNSYKKSIATNAFGLMQLQNGTFVPDNFNHEHYLLIQENDKKILISGCSHKGILNIVEWFKPDFLIGGFHFKSLDVENPCQKLELESYAKKLASYNTKYFTCHCTGTQQFEILKSIMKEKVEYISTGDSIEL